MKNKFFSVAALAVATLAPNHAFAWGVEGHVVVANIAEAYLTPTAKSNVQQLLNAVGASHMADVASWADQVRSSRPETAPWHFVDIPVSANAYNPNRDCANDDCVVARIDLFWDQLQNATTLNDQVEALEFLIHFIGDVHQPLHSADNNDRGGNSVKVSNYPSNANLHRLWDTDFIAADTNDATLLTNKLLASITQANINAWAQGGSEDWANEAHSLAQSVAYAPLPNSLKVTISASYARSAQAAAELQLKRAGIRLAAVLNAVLG